MKVGTRTDLVQDLDKVSTKEKHGGDRKKESNPQNEDLKTSEKLAEEYNVSNVSKNTKGLPAMPRLHKKFDNALLTKIRNAVYFGGANYEIAQRLGVDRKTWYNWRQNDAVKKAIKHLVAILNSVQV